MTNPDPEKLNQYALQLAGYLRGVSLTSSISLGVRLGLYLQMRDSGPLTSQRLAEKSGYHERWEREWLYAQATAEILDYVGEGQFELSMEVATLVAEPENLRSMANTFRGIPERLSLTEKVEESFKTGVGYRFDSRGESIVGMLEGVFGNWQRQVLVKGALPAFEGASEMLSKGVMAADFGCGTGVIVELAKAFPNSTFHGYDHSDLLLKAANDHLHEAGVTNASFHNNDQQPLPSTPTYHFVLTFDCLHDLARPDEMASAIRQAMHPDGLWLIADMDGAANFEENLRNYPRAAVMYANSVYNCLASSMSEPDSLGYGTLGLPEPEMEKLVRAAGFTRFRRVRPDTPGFALPGSGPALYEVRP